MNIEELQKFISECNLDKDKIRIETNLYEAISFLKNNFFFDMLKSITGIDLGEEIELIYNLYSTENEEDVMISIKVQNEK